MFFIIDNIHIASYVDDNTLYSVGKGQYDLETKLQKRSVKLFKWFHENGMKSSPFCFHGDCVAVMFLL